MYAILKSPALDRIIWITLSHYHLTCRTDNVLEFVTLLGNSAKIWLFSDFFSKGTIVLTWNKSEIKVKFKKGKTKTAENYSPIALFIHLLQSVLRE